jgi:hypothetical protein
MDNGSWINWNNIAMGENWHWDFVHNDSNPTQATTFSLTAATHTLCVAYREDDTRPGRPGGHQQRLLRSAERHHRRAGCHPVGRHHRRLAGPAGGVDDSAGRHQYTVEVRTGFDQEAPWVPLAAVTGHTFTNTGLTEFEVYCYRVIANGPTGSSLPSDNPRAATPTSANSRSASAMRCRSPRPCTSSPPTGATASR